MRAATPIRTTAFVLVGLAASASLGIAGEQSGPARDRLAPTISPQGFDSQAVAAAIGRAAPGDTVQLAAGTYELHEAIRPKSKLRLIGAGQEKTTLVYRGTRLARQKSRRAAGRSVFVKTGIFVLLSPVFVRGGDDRFSGLSRRS